jgi:hypothetical protein
MKVLFQRKCFVCRFEWKNFFVMEITCKHMNISYAWQSYPVPTRRGKSAGKCNMYRASEQKCRPRFFLPQFFIVLASLSMVFYCRLQISPLRSCDSIPVLPNNHCDYRPLFTPLISKMLYFRRTRFHLALGLIIFFQFYKEGGGIIRYSDRLGAGRKKSNSRQGKEIFLYPSASRPALGPT